MQGQPGTTAGAASRVSVDHRSGYGRDSVSEQLQRYYGAEAAGDGSQISFIVTSLNPFSTNS